MDRKFINPAPLGLSGFALTTWLLSMVNIGWFSGSNVPLIAACAFAFGGTAQFAAGLLEAPRGNSFGFVAFCGYGAFWWSFAMFVLFLSKGVDEHFLGWYLLLWGVFSTYMWLGSLHKSKVLILLFSAVTPMVYLLAFGKLFESHSLTVLGGYFGLVTAVLAFYAAAAEVVNESWGRIVLPA